MAGEQAHRGLVEEFLGVAQDEVRRGHVEGHVARGGPRAAVREQRGDLGDSDPRQGQGRRFADHPEGEPGRGRRRAVRVESRPGGLAHDERVEGLVGTVGAAQQRDRVGRAAARALGRDRIDGAVVRHEDGDLRSPGPAGEQHLQSGEQDDEPGYPAPPREGFDAREHRRVPPVAHHGGGETIRRGTREGWCLRSHAAPGRPAARARRSGRGRRVRLARVQRAQFAAEHALGPTVPGAAAGGDDEDVVPRPEPEQFDARARRGRRIGPGGRACGRRVRAGGRARGQQVAERGQVRYVDDGRGLGRLLPRPGGERAEGPPQRVGVQRVVEPPGPGEHVGRVGRWRLRHRAARCPAPGGRGGFDHVTLPSLRPRAGAGPCGRRHYFGRSAAPRPVSARTTS